MARRNDRKSRRSHLRDSFESSLELPDSLMSGLSSYPLSLPSEPPDIGEWFSSYQYESPSQRSSLPHLDLECGESEDATDEKGTHLEISQKPQKEGIEAAKKLIYKVTVGELQDIPVVAVNGHRQMCNTSNTVGNSNRDQLLKRKLPSEHENNFSECGLLSTSRTATCNKPGSYNVASNDEIKETSSVCNSGGWVSTRTLKKDLIYKGESNENTYAGVKVKPSNLEFVMKDCSSLVNRRALTDKTNQLEVQAETNDKLDFFGIPGEWNCPRKNKPESGPPLKQLRLERWVRRVM